MKNFFKKIASWSAEAKAGLILCIGAIVIFTSAMIFSAVGRKTPPITTSSSNHSSSTGGGTSTSSGSVNIVDVLLEEVKRPYTGTATVERYFYDINDPVEIRTKAIVKVPGTTSTYIKSVGVDYTIGKKEFNVLASLSGEVIDKVNDATYGNVIVIQHKSGLKMMYASLDNMKVNKGDEVKQGDIIATSGTSLYTQDLGKSLHFEIIKEKTYINPEKAYTTSAKDI